jgi:dihydropteroate synthase
MKEGRGIQYSVEQVPMNFAGHEIIWGARTYIMGILNVTPDSFSDGGAFISADAAVAHAKEMIEQGADVIDIGGESSRPGHIRISAEEEWRRVAPVIRSLSIETNAILSIDTIRAETAEKAVLAGVHIINDIWGLQGDPGIAVVAAKYCTPIIIMHNKSETIYTGNVVDEIRTFFAKSIGIAKEAGIANDRIILDPGFGFGKTSEQNLELMGQLARIKALGYPVLLGTSRKSMIGKVLDLPPKDRIEGTLATTVLGILQGVDMVRVHEVKENLRAARMTDAIVREVERANG